MGDSWLDKAENWTRLNGNGQNSVFFKGTLLARLFWSVQMKQILMQEFSWLGEPLLSPNTDRNSIYKMNNGSANRRPHMEGVMLSVALTQRNLLRSR